MVRRVGIELKSENASVERNGEGSGGECSPKRSVVSGLEEIVAAWPHLSRELRAAALAVVPKAARQDRSLYELLALVDSLREGRARERKLAEAELTHRLTNP